MNQTTLNITFALALTALTCSVIALSGDQAFARAEADQQRTEIVLLQAELQRTHQRQHELSMSNMIFQDKVMYCYSVVTRVQAAFYGHKHTWGEADDE